MLNMNIKYGMQTMKLMLIYHLMIRISFNNEANAHISFDDHNLF
jgi:hypothetical protein